MTTTTPPRQHTVRLEPATWDAIDALAKASDRSINYTLARLIEKALKAPADEKKG